LFFLFRSLSQFSFGFLGFISRWYTQVLLAALFLPAEVKKAAKIKHAHHKGPSRLFYAGGSLFHTESPPQKTSDIE
jgi:hypothetical protein